MEERIWICAIAKMEELYIREWIEWHKKLGIDHIVIGDNNDSDYKYKLLDIIQDYVDSGFVEVVNINDKLGYQMTFYRDVYKKKRLFFDWIGFIDIDEFVELPAYNNDIHLFLSNKNLKDKLAIILPWLNFGDCEQVFFKNKPVKERFTTPSTNNVTKTVGMKYFVRSLHYIKPRSRHDPSRMVDINKCCDPLFKSVKSDFFVKNDKSKSHSCCKVKKEYYENAYISHYITKSTEEYIKYKIIRGRCARSIGKYEIRYTTHFYYRMNRKTRRKERLFCKYENEIKNECNKQLKKYNMI